MTSLEAEEGIILVTGGTGKTGSRVAARLVAAGRSPRIGSRSGSPRFDWQDPSSWAGALEGVDGVYIAYQPDVAMPGALQVLKAFYAQAEAAGVRRAVLLSGRGEPEAQEAEDALRASSLEWTILRASWFFQNFSESFLLEPIRAGDVALPEGLAPEPFVDAEDIAEIAVKALLGELPPRSLYEVSGPAALTFGDALGQIERATGRPIALTLVPQAAYRAALIEAQVPGELVDLLVYLFGTVLDGRNTPLVHGVQQALGRAPTAFQDYVRRTASTGVWG